MTRAGWAHPQPSATGEKPRDFESGEEGRTPFVSRRSARGLPDIPDRAAHLEAEGSTFSRIGLRYKADAQTELVNPTVAG